MNKENELKISLEPKSNNYEIALSKGDKILMNARLTVYDKNKIIKDDRGEIVLVVLKASNELQEAAYIDVEVLDLLVSESIRLANAINRPLMIRRSSVPIKIANNNEFTIEHFDGGYYVHGENYKYNVDNIHNSDYSLLNPTILTSGDNEKIEENLKKGSNKREEELRSHLIYRVMESYAKLLVEINKELEEKGEDLRFSFEFDGVVIMNPYLDIKGINEVDPISYYGMSFIKSIFCDTSSMPEILYSNGYDLGKYSDEDYGNINNVDTSNY